jgi:DNA-directed RNA polymerase specialized sigma24 family protein
VLFAIEQMPQKDVAEALECSVEAVKWHVFQGRKKLKELLKDLM